MKKYLCLLICIVLVCMPASARENAGESAAHYLSLAKKYGDSWDHMNAAVTYQKVLELDPNNYEAAWRAGDQYTKLADALPDNQSKQKESYFSQAEVFCNKAIAIKQNGFEGHLRLSIVYGRLALFLGGKEKVKLGQKIRAEAEKALALNPQSDIAYHVLGRWHQNVGNLNLFLKIFSKAFFGEELDGTNEEAVECFKKAIELNPNSIEHHLELARTYKFMNKKKLMREPLETVLKLPEVEENDPEFKEEARQMLKKLK